MREAIREGFPAAVVEELMRSSRLTLKGLAESLDLSAQSLQRRRRSGRLARLESDRLYRWFAWLRWLITVSAVLSVPFGAIDTEPGARQVEKRPGRIAYGGIS